MTITPDFINFSKLAIEHFTFHISAARRLFFICFDIVPNY